MNERKVLKIILLTKLYKVFNEWFLENIKSNHNNNTVEWYVMDNKIIQFLIHSIAETGEYTLEGIACYTHLPFDVIFDAACGNNRQFSIAPWARIFSLYLQVKPDIAKMLFDKLLEAIKNDIHCLTLLLSE
jgi:hypothetical protein